MVIPNSCLEWIKLQRSGYKDLKNEFITDIEKEYSEMKSFLPENVNTIFDIGCGVGGIDVYLYKHYDIPHIILMDSQFVSRDIKYGFDRGISYYNSFEATKDLMKVNHVFNYSTIGIDVDISIFKNIDLAISLLSWGYHYPVEKYLDGVLNCLSDDGVLILDIRENTNGVDIIREAFDEVVEISNYNKSHRICARRKKNAKKTPQNTN